MKNRPFSRVRCAVFAILIIILAFVASLGALILCALGGLARDNAVTVSMCVFAAVSAAAFLYLILTPPKNEKIIKAIGFAGLMFDIVLVPMYAVYMTFFGG